MLVAVAIVGGCGSGQIGESKGATTTVPEPTGSGSGAFVVATVPEGWVLGGAYPGEHNEPPLREVAYENLRDPDNPNLRWTISGYVLDPAAATKQQNEEAVARDDPAITKVDVRGHVAFVRELSRDDGTTETVVGWSERPDLAVAVSVSSDTGLDAVALANDVRELSEEDYRTAAEDTFFR